MFVRSTWKVWALNHLLTTAPLSSPGLRFSWEVSSVWMGSLGVSTNFAVQLLLSPPAPATAVIIQTHWEGPALLLATHMWWGNVGSLGPWRYFTGFYVCFWWICKRHQTAVIYNFPFPLYYGENQWVLGPVTSEIHRSVLPSFLEVVNQSLRWCFVK